VEQIIKLINNRENFILVGHTSPDGDSIGSCFGLAFALEKLGKHVKVILEPYPHKYHIVPGRHFLLNELENIADIDVLIALDCADVQRLGHTQPLFNRAKTTVCIDHHKTNPGFAQFNHIEPQTSSTSEIVFRLIQQLYTSTSKASSQEYEIDTNIASAIYAGMVSDTGGFRYSSTSKVTMKIAAELIDTGIPFTEIYNEVMHKHSFGGAKAKGVVLQNAMVIADGRIIYSYISRETLVKLGAYASDLDGVIEYLVDTRGTQMAMLAYEKVTTPNICPNTNEPTVKVSFRSQGPDVGAVATALGGGGHQLAAGCTIIGDIETAIAQALPLLERELAIYNGNGHK